MTDPAQTTVQRSPPEDRGAGLRPGQVIAGRYRIQRLLGRGGMGEVYRAEDLALPREVALKFPLLDGDEAAQVRRVVSEVASAQQVSHPNVCRVHEIDRHEGRVFLSMELIVGETLSAILRRAVGSLTGAEKLSIAHDLCAGLGAIHAEEIYFQDFKPGNVMIDSEGRATITDFGLAASGVLADRGGTFEYWAPEQHAGAGPSVESDLYALGLVLYELFVGAPAFGAGSERELAGRKRSGAPLFPAGSEVPEEVREVVTRCLAPAPEERPASAEEVARALPRRPGRGERGHRWIVPPQTLLVSPRSHPRPGRARLAVVALLLALPAVAALAPGSQPTRAAELGHPPEVLAARAREILAAAALDGAGGDELSGYGWDPGRFDPVAVFAGRREMRGERAADRPAVVFWYRRSPERLRPEHPGDPFRRYDDPPWQVAGMAGVHLDPEGRLLRLDAVPDPAVEEGPPRPAPDWRPLLRAAGLEPDRLSPAAPSWTPAVFADRRLAWEGPGATAPEERVRIEVASRRGTPVSLLRVEPRGAGPPRPGPRRAATQMVRSPTGRVLASLWFGAVLAGAVLLARRHLVRRVADAKAALRLALAVVALRLLVWLLGAEHLPGPGEIQVLNAHLSRALLAGAQVGIIYLAVEPFVRRFWPHLAASWVRLVYGRVKDPLVGYHLLFGALAGTVAVLASRLYASFAGTLGLPRPRLEALGTLAWMVQARSLDLQAESLRGLRHALAVEVLAVLHGVLVSFFAVVGVVVLRLLLRRPALSRPAVLAVFVAVLFPAAGHPVADLVMTLGVCLLWLVALLRFGFLAAVTATVCAWLLSSHPLTLDLAAWYAPGSMLALGAVAVIGLYGFGVSLAGEPVLPTRWLELDEPGTTA